MNEYVYLDAQPSTSYACKWISVPTGTKLQGIYLVVSGNPSSSAYTLGEQRKVSLQLDDPLGAVIFQGDVIVTNQGQDTVAGVTKQYWNGFISFDVEISSPGTYTLVWNGRPDDLDSAAVLTGPAVIQGTAFRVRL